ncbi:hypothetical protein, partial [Klebsiella pneumoniae]
RCLVGSEICIRDSSDEALIEEVKRNYLTLIGYWREARR